MREKLQRAYEEKRREAKTKWAAFEKARDEARSEGVDLTDMESPVFDTMDTLHKDYATSKQEAEQLHDRLLRTLEMDSEGEKGASPFERAERKADERSRQLWSPAQGVLQSDEYKALVKSGALEMQRARVELPPVKALDRTELKNLLTGAGADTGGALIVEDRQAGIVELPRRPFVMANLVTVGSTDSDTVEYVRMASRTNAAAETPEATTTADAAANAPESGFTLAVESALVKEIPHYIPATKRSLADAGQLSTLIDQELREGILERLDNQLLNGDGTGENLTGMLNTAGLNSVVKDATGGESMVDAIHRAVTATELQFYGVSAILLHPTNWEEIRLAKNGNGDYLYGPPSQPGPMTIWGYPVVKSPVVPVGQALLGDFRRAATLFVRAGVAISATDSHDDWFIRRLVAVMASFRAAFAVQRPAALAEVDLVGV